MTTAISASSLPAATLAAMASKFDPRPESRMPSRSHRYSTRGAPALALRPRGRCERRLAARASGRFGARLAAFFAGTAKIMPTPRLKVRRQSSCGTLPMRRSSFEDAAGPSTPSCRSRRARPLGSMRGVLSVIPPPVMCAAPLSRSGLSKRAHRLQIAAMHLEQLVADGAPNSGTCVSTTVARDLEQQLARERIAVGVQAGRRQREQHVALADLFAGEAAACARPRRR